jgi:hypothetical protein
MARTKRMTREREAAAAAQPKWTRRKAAKTAAPSISRTRK